MADQQFGVSNGISKRLRDMGDGTFAELIAVSGSGDTIAPAVTVQAAAYASGNCIGGLLALPDFIRSVGQTTMLGSAMLRTKIANTVEIQALIFRANPSASTFNDKTAAVLHPDDVDKIARIIRFDTWISPLGAPSFSQADNINRIMSLPSGLTTAYAALIGKGAITFASPSDLSLVLANHRN